jgi:hypothetical protein
LVYEIAFWTKLEEIKAIEFLVVALQMVDEDKPTMGYIYEAMDQVE